MRTLWLPLLSRLVIVLLLSLALAGTIWWDNAANRGIAGRASETPISWADVPLGGVNTYLLNAEVVTSEQRATGDNKVARTFRMIRDGGFHFVRIQFPWEDIEVCGRGDYVDCRPGSEGASTWIKYDYIVEQAREHGLELIVRLDRPPDWAREQVRHSPEVEAAESEGYPVTGPPDHYEDYASFVGDVARRYRDDLRFFQIWNEPNLPGEWNYQRQDPADLLRLLRLAGAAIKQANPDAVILFPALSQTDGADGTATNDLEYLQGVYDAGGIDAFDIMSAQLYGLGQPPDEHRYVTPGNHLLRPIETRTDIGRIVLLREIMERNGDAAKAIWVSEVGWNSAPFEHPWGASTSEQQKAEYLVGMMERAEAEWPWLGAMCVWMFRFGGEPPHPADPTPYFQLVDWEFNPLPAYNALATYLAAPSTIPRAQPSALPVVATALASLGLIAATAWLLPVLVSSVVLVGGKARRIVAATGRRVGGSLGPRLRSLPRPSGDRLPTLAIVVGLVIFYRLSAQLPITLLGALIFVPAALLRPDLALLAVPVTAPLYLAPKGIWDARFGLSRPQGYLFPLHEFVLLVCVAGTLLLVLRMRAFPRFDWRRWRGYWPLVLFLVAGTLGVVFAAGGARGAALREWRWLIVEPVIFYGLARFFGRDALWRRRLLWAWIGTGVVVAIVGVVQLAGLNLALIIRPPVCFSEAVVAAEGVRRATSVYCHPNNLGLALGRVWPLLAAIVLVTYARSNREPESLLGDLLRPRGEWFVPAVLCAIVLAGIAASFSKGAMLGALAALLTLGLVLRQRPVLVATAALVLVIVAGAALTRIERLNPLGGSSGARVELWASAAAMLRDHPNVGVGLDQFYALRTREGSPYLAPEAAETSERFASHPHNLLLDTLLRIGPLGLVALLALVARFTRRAAGVARGKLPDQRALGAGLLAAMVAALVHGLVDNFYFVPDLAFVFWLQLAVVDGMAEEQRAATGERPMAANLDVAVQPVATRSLPQRSRTP